VPTVGMDCSERRPRRLLLEAHQQVNVERPADAVELGDRRQDVTSFDAGDPSLGGAGEPGKLLLT
jgi:hypothetical protein